MKLIAEIKADAISISGPTRLEGNFKITLNTGVYSAEEISKLLLESQDCQVTAQFFKEDK